MKRIVVTHKHPDFDALASAYGAYRLFKLDTIVTASSYDTSVREYIDSLDYDLPITHIKEKEIESIKELDLLVVTDCKLSERLGILAPLLSVAKKVIVVDHHPSHGMDIEADEKLVDEIGSCTSIIVNKLKAENARLTQDEATLLMMGIYEDTGNLTFSGTTVADMDAASWLLSNGANLQFVNDFVKRELSRDHVFILNELLTNINILTIGSVTIGVSNASNDKYIEDISYLAHKIMDIESLDALFILVRTGDRIILVGRSRTDDVNAADIAQHFGGGGHFSAASAVIKEQTLHESIGKLDMIIRDAVRPAKTAKDIMNAPVKTLKADSTFSEAIDVFMKNNLNMMPVVSGKVPVGLVSRRDILHGLKHGLNDEPVSSIMQVEFEFVLPDTPYYHVEEIMLNRNLKMVVVVKDNNLLGVITRTDLLRLIHDEIAKMPKFSEGRLMLSEDRRFKNISGQIDAVLPDRVVATLKNVGAMADALGYKCYLVGGVVRDILLRKANEDIDIVVEGSAPDFARRFASEMGAKVAVHDKFKTAVVIFPDGFRVDFATSRTEYYDFPASAPTVEDASIKNDLFRRDFSINAMAVKLNKKEYGTLLDFFGGQRDLMDKKIRVLHSLSFVDDPSRAFRAVRFAVRFDFMIGPHTDRLFRHAVNLNLFDRVMGQRMFLELKYILSEKNYKKALRMMRKYDLLKFYHKSLRLDERKEQMFDDLEVIMDWYCFQFDDEFETYLPRFIILFHDMDKEHIREALSRFQLDEKKSQELENHIRLAKETGSLLNRRPNQKNSYFTMIFNKMSVPCALAAAVLAGEKFDDQVKNYFTSYRNIKTDINGNDLMREGILPKMLYADILKVVKDAKIDGLADTYDSQMALARETADKLVKDDQKNA